MKKVVFLIIKIICWLLLTYNTFCLYIAAYRYGIIPALGYQYEFLDPSYELYGSLLVYGFCTSPIYLAALYFLYWYSKKQSYLFPILYPVIYVFSGIGTILIVLAVFGYYFGTPINESSIITFLSIVISFVFWGMVYFLVKHNSKKAEYLMASDHNNAEKLSEDVFNQLINLNEIEQDRVLAVSNSSSEKEHKLFSYDQVEKKVIDEIEENTPIKSVYKSKLAVKKKIKIRKLNLWIIILGIVIIASSIIVIIFTADNRIYNRAQQSIYDHEYLTSINEFSRLIENFPNSKLSGLARNELPKVKILYAQQLWDSSNFSGAKDILIEIITVYPNSSFSTEADNLLLNLTNNEIEKLITSNKFQELNVMLDDIKTRIPNSHTNDSVQKEIPKIYLNWGDYLYNTGEKAQGVYKYGYIIDNFNGTDYSNLAKQKLCIHYISLGDSEINSTTTSQVPHTEIVKEALKFYKQAASYCLDKNADYLPENYETEIRFFDTYILTKNKGSNILLVAPFFPDLLIETFNEELLYEYSISSTDLDVALISVDGIFTPQPGLYRYSEAEYLLSVYPNDGITPGLYKVNMTVDYYKDNYYSFVMPTTVIYTHNIQFFVFVKE